MTIKYKVTDVAKDLNIANKEIIDLMTSYFGGEPKKATTTLTEEELNVIFEHYTQKNQVPNFNDYFATRVEKPKEEKKDPVAVAPKKPAEQARPAGNASPSRPADNASPSRPADNASPSRPAGNASPSRPAGNASPSRPAGNASQNRTANNTTSRFDPNKNGRFDHKPILDNTKPKPKVENKPRDPKTNSFLTPGAKPTGPVITSNEQVDKDVRHVDTKSADVNLEKYNEHYEKIAPQGRMKDTQQKKQKLKQRSAIRNKAKFSNKKETEAEKMQRLLLERARKQQLKVLIPEEIIVSELASRLKVTVADVIKKLMLLGVMAAQHESVDFDTASLVAMEYNAKIEKEVVVTIEEKLIKDEEDETGVLTSRSPIVVVMGHVDHGKTSLLDRIRHADVTSTEAGGITQHIGAYRAKIGDRYVTFLDTPGHEAFTSMRARGAGVTDIAILVVAADDGIMPQTVEAINHAKAAGVSIIVAINKMDKPDANPDKIMQSLTEYELVPEEWGGDVICVPVSATTGQGIDTLLEMITVVAEVQDLKANPDRLAKGTVVEARLDKGRGPIATLLVQNGTLRTGDVIIAGTSVGHVRQMVDDRGNVVTEAGPSMPVEITGMAEVPAAGDVFNAVEDERLARELVSQRRQEQKEELFGTYQKVTLDNLFSQIAEGEMKELALIVKADVQGTAEAVKQSLEKLSDEEVRVRVIHTGVGAINKSDVMLANASNAIIVGFNVRPDPVAKADAEQDNVELRMYRIIYDAIDDVKAAMKGMLDPKVREVQLGRAEVRLVYKITNVGTIAGCYVLEGKVARNALIRVVRDGIVIAEDQIDSLKRFKNDAKDVAQGYECGIGLDKFNDIKEGDIFESFILEEYRD